MLQHVKAWNKDTADKEGFAVTEVNVHVSKHWLKHEALEMFPSIKNICRKHSNWTCDYDLKSTSTIYSETLSWAASQGTV